MVRRLFVTPDGRLALVWRLLLFIILVVYGALVFRFGIGFIIVSLFGVDIPSGASAVAVSILAPTLTIAFVIVLTYLFRRFVDRRPWSGMALPALNKRRGVELLVGLLLGTLMMTVIFAIEWAAGWVSIVGTEVSTSGLAVALGYLVVNLFPLGLLPGIKEELTDRGYVFQNLGERLPVWAVILLMSLYFGAQHYSNPEGSLAFVVGITLFGVLFALMRLLTGALWLGIGLHTAYDFTQFAVFGITTYDDPDYGHNLIHVTQSGSALWVGEGPAVEAGLVALGVLVLAIAVAAVLFTRQRGASAWLARLNEDGSLTSAEAQDRPEKLDRR